jgi:hypothetical protein
MIENEASLRDMHTQYPKKYFMYKPDCFDFRFNFILSRSNFSNEFLWQTDEVNETFLSPNDIIKFKKYKEIVLE